MRTGKLPDGDVTSFLFKNSRALEVLMTLYEEDDVTTLHDLESRCSVSYPMVWKIISKFREEGIVHKNGFQLTSKGFSIVDSILQLKDRIKSGVRVFEPEKVDYTRFSSDA